MRELWRSFKKIKIILRQVLARGWVVGMRLGNVEAPIKSFLATKIPQS